MSIPERSACRVDRLELRRIERDVTAAQTERLPWDDLALDVESPKTTDRWIEHSARDARASR